MSVGPAVETHQLAKRYGARFALHDCTITVPPGRISALVGPNGAGKTTLLKILVGLRHPSDGTALVFGRAPQQDPAFLADIGFLAQEVPLYRRFTADDHIRIGGHLNRPWDAGGARARLRDLEIPLDQPVGTLSGGQRAQVGLGLALAKHPRLLLLDEPVAALDPLARRQFLAALAAACADDDLTVVMSSHLVHDLERVCDHLVLLAAARPQLCGDIDVILDEHRIVTGPTRDTSAIERDHEVIDDTSTDRQTNLVVRTHGPIVDPRWEVYPIDLEDLVLAYMTTTPSARGPHQLPAVGAQR